MGSRMHSRLSANGSRRSSRSGSDEYMQIEIGTVNLDDRPWSFSVKLEDGSTIQCQLQGVQELPVAKYFLRLADDLDGHFEMAIVGHVRKIRLVLLQMQVGDIKRDVAAVLRECHATKSHYQIPKKSLPTPSITLPHHEKFFESIQQNQMMRKQHDGSDFSYEESEYAFQPTDVDGASYTSHYGDRNGKVLSKGYDTTSKPAPYCRNKVVGLPEMRSDSMLRGYNRASSSSVQPRITSSRAPSTIMNVRDHNKNSLKCKDQNWLWGKEGPGDRSPPSIRSARASPPRATFSQLDVSQFFGNPFRSFISHVDNPDNFYIIPDKLMQDKFLAMIQNKYLSKPKEAFPAVWQNTAFAIEVAGKWQRGLVKAVYNDGRTEVFLVDSGWKGVSHWPMKLLDPEDASVPPKAICCMMRGVHRLDWTKDEIARLKGLRDKVDIMLFSQVGTKYSAVIIEENESVFNATFGLCGLVDLLRKTNINILAMQEGMTYEVKPIGSSGKQVYLKLKERCADLVNMENQLKDLVGKEPPITPKKGQFALAVDDNNVRRAKILKASSMSTHATCLFVDHGLTKEIPFSQLYHLPEHFMVQPAFAILCALAPRESVWPMNKYLMVTVLGEVDGIPVVGLAKDGEESCIGNQPSEDDSQMSHTLHRSSRGPSPVPFRPSQSHSLITTRSRYAGLNSVAPSVAHRPSVAATLARGFVDEPAQSRSEPAKLNIDSTSLPEGVELGTVTYVQSSSLVYVRLASRDAEFAKLQAQIDQEAQNARSEPLDGEKMCLAFSKGHWMRAEILPGGRALFIDVGHRGSLGEVRRMSSDLKHKAAATLLCLAPANLEGLKEGCRVHVKITADGNKIVGLAASQEGMQVDAKTAVKKAVIVLDIELPQRVWLVEDTVSFNLMSDSLRQLDRNSLTGLTNPVVGDMCAVRVDDQWHRAKVVNVDPLTFFLVDLAYNNVNMNKVKKAVHLNRLLKMVPPLAKPFDLVKDEISEKSVTKIKRILAKGKESRALIQEDALLGLWIDGINVLEAAGYLVKVHVTFIDEDGSVWVARKTKAEKRTQNLQCEVINLSPLTKPTVGTRCVALNMIDNMWYRAEVVGLSRHFKIMRFLDIGTLGESLEFREWWNKPETDARNFHRLKMAVKMDQELLTPKIAWSAIDQPPLFNLDMVRIN
ncbi:Hypothetical predicted protein [Cloeon dipterum]|uniref:Tudor domain-containing protein n=1 Tax=Cloeon dipterum TaxID=197152 RepID=A0A8S1CV38_9INSE|nr:Hypothetical predicted protein [Cloeon dipterum]